jgi:hypothetical protein
MHVLEVRNSELTARHRQLDRRPHLCPRDEPARPGQCVARLAYCLDRQYRTTPTATAQRVSVPDIGVGSASAGVTHT